MNTRSPELSMVRRPFYKEAILFHIIRVQKFFCLCGKNGATENLMKKKFLTIFTILILVTLSACGSAEPTMSAEDLANTAVADAWIAITQTQAALPTATPIPPTNTPEPTATQQPTFPPTLPPLPTLAAATVAGPTVDVCNQIPVAKPNGAVTTVEIRNQSQGQANLSFGMNTPNAQGECFTYSFSLGMGDTVTAQVLTGCYWGYAWIDGPEDSNARSGDTLLCLPDSLPTYHVVISKERIELK